MEKSTFWNDLKSGKFADMVVKEARGKALAKSDDVYNVIKPLLAEIDDVEAVHCIFLDNKNRVLKIEKLFSGSLVSAAIYPREIIKRVIDLKAAAVIMTHNHVSGDPEPSIQDRSVTRKIYMALAMIDVKLLDHIIIGEGYHSLTDEGVMVTLADQFKRFMSGV